jgi:hypothetical protein
MRKSPKPVTIPRIAGRVIVCDHHPDRRLWRGDHLGGTFLALGALPLHSMDFQIELIQVQNTGNIGVVLDHSAVGSPYGIIQRAEREDSSYHFAIAVKFGAKGHSERLGPSLGPINPA